MFEKRHTTANEDPGDWPSGELKACIYKQAGQKDRFKDALKISLEA